MSAVSQTLACLLLDALLRSTLVLGLGLLAGALAALLWMQPLLPWVRRAWEQATEETCDLAALEPGMTPRAFAGCLVRLAERLEPRERAGAIGLIGFRSSLGRRVEGPLEQERRPARLPSPRLRGAVTLAGLCGAAVIALTVPSAALPQDTGLGDDPRLAQPVTVTAEGVALAELLPLVSQKTGVTLEAYRTIADEKVIVFGPARPLKELLADLAELLGDDWLRFKAADGRDGYRLVRSVRAQRYEERLASAGDDQLQAHLEAQVAAVKESEQELARRPADDPVRRFLADPDARLATRIFALLSPEQRRLLVDRWQVRLPVSALDPSLKAAIEGLFHGPRFQPDADGLKPTEIPTAEMDRHGLTFSIWGNGGGARSEGTLRVTMDAPTGFYLTMTEFRGDAKFPLAAHGNPYTGKRIEGDAGLPDPRRIEGLAEGALPDRLRLLAERTGRPVVADYYRSKPILIAARGEVANDAPGIRALDTLCRPDGYLWWTRGQALLLRKRDWYNQRRYETPDRWVLELAARLRRQNGIPTYGDALRLLDLTTLQLVGLAESAGGFADRRQFMGLRELLAATAGAGPDRFALVPHGEKVIGRDIMPLDASVRVNVADPKQRELARAFFDAFHRRIDAGPAEPFGFLFQSTPPREKEQQGRSLPLALMIAVGDRVNMGYLLALPLTLPDDRRDRTRVAVGS